MRSSERGLATRATGWLRDALRRAGPADDDNASPVFQHPADQPVTFPDPPSRPVALGETLTEYFRIVSFHGTDIGVQIRSGVVACMPEGPSVADYAMVVAFRLRKAPGLLFLVANTDQPTRINLGDNSYHAVILPVAVSGTDDRATLHDPRSGRYLVAPPIRGADHLAGITANRDRADKWEHFRLVGLDASGIAGSVIGLAGTTEQLHGAAPDTGVIAGFISKSTDPNLAIVLDSIVPLLGTRELSALSGQFLETAQLRAGLLRHYPDDLWAGAGIGDLAEWITPRDASTTGAKAASQESRITIGPELDVLALGAHKGKFVAGGRFLSFPQACNTIARRQVEPRRRACIVMSARNEGIYLLEWIAYHRAIGFDWFYIYSNNNDDGSDDLLGTLADAGIITWIRNEMAPGARSQYKAYGHALGVLPGILDFEWCLVADADEFFVPNPDRFMSVSDFLSWQERVEVDAIALNWKFSASNNEVGCLDELMTRRNTHFAGAATIGDGMKLIKTMFRPRLMMCSRAHTPICDERNSFIYRLSTGELHEYRSNPKGFHADPGFSDSVNTENACIYHYFFKSAEEWLWKASRNRGDQPMSVGLPPRMFTDAWIKEFMLQNDEQVQEQDSRMPVFAPGVDSELAYLRSLPRIAEISATIEQSYRQRLEELKSAMRSSPFLGSMNELSRRFMDLAGIT